MEALYPDLDEIKQLSLEIVKIEQEKEHLQQQLNQYKSSVSTFIHKIRRAESLMDLNMEQDPDMISLTESTNQKVQNMEDKINILDQKVSQLGIQYENLFEKRRVIVQRVDQDLNKTITYAYPFGKERPTIRLGKFYHITDEGDVMCEMRIESNSYFDDTFHPVL